MAVDWAEAERVRGRIAELAPALEALYALRRDLMREMDKTMSRREIGDWWGVSNVAATKVINGDKYKVRKGP